MKERPILFSGPMVRAILDGRKTQTRRVVKCQTGDLFDVGACVAAVQEWRPVFDEIAQKVVGKTSALIRCPYGAPGDRLWVRETCQAVERPCGDDGVHYPADGAWRKIENSRESADRWCDLLHYGRRQQKRALAGAKVPAIHMPRWASRITLEITGVRVERLNDCSEADALAEGIERIRYPEVGEWGWPQRKYRELWEHINGPDSWTANPWVWVVEFRRIAAEDAVIQPAA